MTKDILFLLPPGFEANGRREFCPECAEIWGVLSYYPAIREAVDIRYVGIEHPRGPICALLGEGRYNAPTLVLAAGNRPSEGVLTEVIAGREVIQSARMIAKYFAGVFGTALPRGTA